METALAVALVGVTGALLSAVVVHFAAPLLSPWYNERMRKAQARIDRRATQRLMIENELEKAFDDLSAVRSIVSVIVAWRAWGDQSPEALRTVEMFARNEEKWGVWRPYLIEDDELLKLCEKYRADIHALRIEAVHMASSIADAGKPGVPVAKVEPEKLQTRLPRVERTMEQRAREIVAAMDKRGW